MPLAPKTFKIGSNSSRPTTVIRMEAITSSTVALPRMCSASAFRRSPSRMETWAVAAETDEHAEGQHDQHERESDGDGGNAIAADRPPDEDSVDEIVEGLGHHAHDGGRREPQQQPRDAALPELRRPIGVHAKEVR